MLSCCHSLRYYKDLGTSIALSDIHSHWLYNHFQISISSHVKYLKELAVTSQHQHANKITQFQQQQHSNKGQHDSKQILNVAKASQDDQHDVYTTDAGPVVGSSSTASFY